MKFLRATYRFPLPSILVSGLIFGITNGSAQVDPQSASLFGEYDTNGDERISLDEFMSGPFSKRGDNRRALTGRFEEIDADGDGSLSLPEYSGARLMRDRERTRRGKNRREERPDGRERSPLSLSGERAAGTLDGKWRSPLVKKAIPIRIRIPDLDPAETCPVVVYLKGLASPRLGTHEDRILIDGFIDDGMMVVEIDYRGDRRARAPEMLAEIDLWYGSLAETEELPVDARWIYVVPEGYTIDRKVRIVDTGDLAIDMDVMYPSGDASPVPLMLQITSIKDAGFWINQRAYYIYGMLTHGFAGAIMEHNGGTRFSPKGELFPEKRAARLLRAEAERWNLSGQLGVTGHSKGSSRAAKAAFLNDGEREGDPGPHGEQSDRFQAALLSAGQHATEYLIEDGYLDEVGPEKRAAAEREFERMTRDEMLEISTTTYVTPDDTPAFLCVGERDKQFRINQMTRLARKCREVGVEHRFVIQPDMPHQYIDDPEVIGQIFRFLDRHLK